MKVKCFHMSSTGLIFTYSNTMQQSPSLLTLQTAQSSYLLLLVSFPLIWKKKKTQILDHFDNFTTLSADKKQRSKYKMFAW